MECIVSVRDEIHSSLKWILGRQMLLVCDLSLSNHITVIANVLEMQFQKTRDDDNTMMRYQSIKFWCIFFYEKSMRGAYA